MHRGGRWSGGGHHDRPRSTADGRLAGLLAIDLDLLFADFIMRTLFERFDRDGFLPVELWLRRLQLVVGLRAGSGITPKAASMLTRVDR